MGRIAHVEVVVDRLPDLSEMDPTAAYLGLEIRFETDADRQRILDAFEFVSEGSALRLVPPHARIEAYLQLLEALPESNARLGELLVACRAVTPGELEMALRLQAQAGPAHPALGRILVSEQIVPPTVVAAALEKQHKRKGPDSVARDTRLLKVEAEKLDRLIDLVGELVIASASARLAARSEGARASEEAIANLGHLVESIRDSSLGLRMVPVGEVFNRFPRVVRDLSKELGKDVAVEITGAETELDKSMIDKLGDPLTHIVRNAMDHGIESREIRLAAGKPAEGTIRFHAYHETGSIVIEVSDDGGGIRRSKVLARAVERGLVAPGQELSDRDILHLIFEPGFSTAEAVTNLSGRGVGMDVVKKTIEGLRGEIELESEEGVGSVLRMRMPLTLAIIDGFLVGVGSQSYVVPLDMVVECADLPAASGPAARARSLANLRGEPLPLVHLREQFSLPGSPPKRQNILVVEYGGRRAGLVVDRLVGEFQTVIKPLSRLFSGLRGIGGSTILGTGEVALILDVPALVTRMEHADNRGHALAPPASPLLEGASA
jgi:two-component system chemotaxis sensor kinase CheA